MKKADLVAKDKLLAKLFQDSESGKAPYRLPFRAVHGSYTGCSTCNVAGLKSHGGSVAGGSATTTAKATTKVTTRATTKAPATTKVTTKATTNAPSTDQDYPHDNPGDEEPFY